MSWTPVSLALSLFIAGLARLSHGDAADDPPQRRFPTAEMADAVMGAAPLIPSELQESLLGEPCAGEDRPEELLSAVIHTDTGEQQSQNSTDTAKTFKVTCDRRNVSGVERFIVHVLNASQVRWTRHMFAGIWVGLRSHCLLPIMHLVPCVPQDLMELLNANGTECSLVLFYTPWCQFSASLAPHFNALPRVFPSMHFLALDASQHSSLSTRFGTVAVPNILLFQGAKPMARFNQTDRTLETLTSFITNQTGFEASPDQAVQEDDRAGPLPAVPVKSIDWLFVFSVLFISGFTLYAILCTESIRWLIPGQDHEHQD